MGLTNRRLRSQTLIMLGRYPIWSIWLLWPTKPLTSFARTGRELFVRQTFEIPIQAIAINQSQTFDATGISEENALQDPNAQHRIRQRT